MLVSKIKSRPVSGLSYHNLIQHNFTVAGAVLGLTSSMKTHQLPDYPTKKITPLKCLASTLKIGCYCYLFTKKSQWTSKHPKIQRFRVRGSGFGVRGSGSGFGGRGSGFGVRGSGFGFGGHRGFGKVFYKAG